MFRNMGIGKKIAYGFGAIVILLGIVALWSISGISNIVRNAEEVIKGNELRGVVVQREVDHLNWANNVNALLTDENVTELNIQTDPHQCGFGKWYYSEAREQAEKSVPEIKEYLDSIEKPHNHLHQSVIEIRNVFTQADIELGNFLREKKTDHLAWAHLIKDAFLEESVTKLDAQLDPTKCSLGKWMSSPDVAKLKFKYPDFASALAELEEPHQKLHESAKHIEQMLVQNSQIEAKKYFMQNTKPLLSECLAAINGMLAWQDKQIDGLHKANAIYSSQTKPALNQVQHLLGKISKSVEGNIMTDDAMLAAASRTKTVVMIFSIVAGFISIFLAFTIARGII
ncbi:MAG: chemotaxis protein, partial [candidate division Zixibacteria bacterium]|nr:chemotaxis protein [candidate division Zixibacteria bacterium]